MNLLVVEDNAGDVHLLREFLQEGEEQVRVVTVTDGEQALAYLRREGAYAGAVGPDLILLDLYLPRKDGDEVLREVQADPALRAIPVMILTGTVPEAVRRQLLAAGAERVLRKPVDLEEYPTLVGEITAWWRGRRPPGAA